MNIRWFCFHDSKDWTSPFSLVNLFSKETSSFKLFSPRRKFHHLLESTSCSQVNHCHAIYKCTSKGSAIDEGRGWTSWEGRTWKRIILLTLVDFVNATECFRDEISTSFFYLGEAQSWMNFPISRMKFFHATENLLMVAKLFDRLRSLWEKTRNSQLA